MRDPSQDVIVPLGDGSKVRFVEGYYLGEGPQGPPGPPGTYGPEGPAGPIGPQGLVPGVDRWMSVNTINAASIAQDVEFTLSYTPVKDQLGVNYGGSLHLHSGYIYLVMGEATMVSSANNPNFKIGYLNTTMVSTQWLQSVGVASNEKQTLPFYTIVDARSQSVDFWVLASCTSSFSITDGWINIYLLLYYPAGEDGPRGLEGSTGPAGPTGPQGPTGPPGIFNTYDELLNGT